jgi:hypothetical protein
MLRKSFHPDRNGDLPLPPVPTEALPGTPEKLAVFRQRAAARMRLWHPEDPRIP